MTATRETLAGRPETLKTKKGKTMIYQYEHAQIEGRTVVIVSNVSLEVGDYARGRYTAEDGTPQVIDGKIEQLGEPEIYPPDDYYEESPYDRNEDSDDLERPDEWE